MLHLPNNLVPVDDPGWSVRPERARLDVEEVRTALWAANGNFSRAAEIMKVPTARIRRFIGMSNYLHGEWLEIQEQLLDAAERNVREALNDRNDPNRRDRMARFVLERSHREWKPRTLRVNAPPNGHLRLVWSDGKRVDG